MQDQTPKKPALIRIELPDGKRHFHGVGKAARYLGCSYGGLYCALHGIDNKGRELLPVVRREWPDVLPADERPEFSAAEGQAVAQ